MRYGIVIVMVLVAMTPSGAQVLIGVELGVLQSELEWVRNPPPSGAFIVEGRTAFHGGAEAEVQLSQWITLGSGLAIVPKGGSVDGRTIHVTYFEIPLFARLSAPSRSGVFLEGGLSLGVRASCDRFFLTSSGVHRNDCGAEDVHDVAPLPSVTLTTLRRTNVSYRAGVGGRVAIGSATLVLVARLHRGLINLDPDSPDQVKMPHFGLMLGYAWAR